MAAADVSKLGKDWQYYVTAVGLLRAGYWEQQLPASCMPALRQHLSSFEAWTRFFGLEQLEASDGRRSERTAEGRSSSKSRKQRSSTSKSRGADVSQGRHEQEGKASKGSSAARKTEAGGQSGDEDIPPPSELTEFLESDQSLLQERKELLGEEGMLSMRVRVLLFDVLMQNAMHLEAPSILLGKQSAMAAVGPHVGNASAGGGATGIVYNETPGPADEGDCGDHQMPESSKVDEEQQRKQRDEQEQRSMLARLSQAPPLDFSSEDRLAATADPILRYGLRQFYRLEDMFYTLEYDAEDLAFEQERHQGIPRGVLPDVPLPKPDSHSSNDDVSSGATETTDGSVPIDEGQSGEDAAKEAPASAAAEGSTGAVQAPASNASQASTPITPAASSETREVQSLPKVVPSSSRFLASSLGESRDDIPTRESMSPDRSPGSNDGSPRDSSSRELRNLLSDVKPHKPWSGSPIDGQEELCASLEEVMVALKGYTKHSYPFLTRVRKCDAPDYYEVIKEPMDLGKMHKKLKRLDYYSKQEFIDDLDLMFENCRRYNTDPKSIYRTHAKMLDKKAKTLLKKVPDIDISADRCALEDASKPRRGRPPRPQVPGSAPAGASRPRGRPRKHSLEPRGEDESPSPVITPIGAAKRGRPGRPRKYPAEESPSRSQSPATAKRKRGRPGRPRKLRPEELYHEPEYMLAQMLQFTEPDDITTEDLVKEYFSSLEPAQRLDFLKEDPQIRLWRVRTLAARLRAAREREICKELPFAEHRELRRTPKDMFQFVCNYASHCDELGVDSASGHYDDELYCDVGSYADTEEADFMEKRPTFSTSNLPQVIDITIESTKKKRGRGRISNVERQKIQEEQEIKRAMAMRAPMDKSTCENYFMPEALPQCAVPDMPHPLPPLPPHCEPYAFCTAVESQMAANLPALRAIHRLREVPVLPDADGDVTMAPAPSMAPAFAQPLVTPADTIAAAAAASAAAAAAAAAAAVTGPGPAAASEPPTRGHEDVTPTAFAERSFLSHRNPEASRVMLMKAVAVAAEHAGFQSAETSALEVLTDGCIRYLERFAAAVQAHQVVFCNKAKPEALLTRCLYEMGVDGLQGLRSHMEEDVEMRGKRLQQAVQLAAQHSKLPPPEVARLSCPTKVVTPQGGASGLADRPPVLCVQPHVPREFQMPTRPAALRKILAAGHEAAKRDADSGEESGKDEEHEDEDVDMEEAEEVEDGNDEESDGEEGNDEESNGEESNDDDGEEDGEEDNADEEEKEEEPRRKVTRSSRSSTLGKRSQPEPRTTRTTRSRQDPSPKTPKTRGGAGVTPPQRRRSRPQRTRNT